MIREQTTLLNIENPAIEIQSNTIITFASMKTPYQDFIKNRSTIGSSKWWLSSWKKPKAETLFLLLSFFLSFFFFFGNTLHTT